MDTEQLVVPMQCGKAVLKVAYKQHYRAEEIDQQRAYRQNLETRGYDLLRNYRTSGEWSALIVLVKKRDGSLYLFADYW